MSTWTERFLSYFFAHWHLRRMSRGTSGAAKRERRVWCRDNCASFAGRWFAVAAVLLLMQSFPLHLLLVWDWMVPVTAVGSLVAFVMGLWHLVWQIVAQSRVGPPTIEPPVEINSPERRRYEKRF